MVTAIAKPNCLVIQTEQGAQAWCASHKPIGLELTNINASISRLLGRGGVCAELADAADALLASNGLHIWTPTSNQYFSGAAAIGGDWAVLDRMVVLLWSGSSTDAHGVNLDALLAHEMDHHMARFSAQTNAKGHLVENNVENPYHSVNSRQCSGAGI